MNDQGDNVSEPSPGQDVGSSASPVSTEAPEKDVRRQHGKSAASGKSATSGSRKIAHIGRKKSPSGDAHAPAKKHGKFFLFFGVILPVLAMLFEITTHYCARHFFDPFPSANHVVLFSLIPLSNYLAWLAVRKDLSAHYGFMSLISGMALGIGCLYALMFLPLTPQSCLFSLFFGFGLLGLAPLLAIPCTWLSGKSVCKLATNKKTYFNPHQVEHIGHLIVLCMVVAVELPSTLTRMNLSLAADPATAKQGIEWLRQYGSQEVMLRACYERSGRATDILGSLYESAHPVTVDQARKIFYYVTGKPFNSVAIPSSARATMQHAGNVTDIAGVNAKVQDEFDLDADIAGEAVSGVARGLSVSDSSISGKVDPDAAIADLHWAFTFKNVSAIDREARAKILLPPGAVVTKATLTVNGQEREATVMVRSEARAYYRQAIAEHKKDPLLVSMCGLDQLLVQCFPVQPNSTMMVKLSIAAPLTIDEKQKAVLVLPTFEERNFQFDVADSIDLESANSISLSGTTGSAAQPGADKNVHFTAKVEPAQLGSFASFLQCDRNTNVHVAFCADTVARNGSLIEHRIRPQHYSKPDRLTVLIDGSAAMENYKSDIVQALKGLPNSTKIVVIGDDTTVLIGDDTVLSHFQSGAPDYATALTWLEKFQFVGGHDDGTELVTALESTKTGLLPVTVPGNPPATGTSELGAVLWIHAAQPLSIVSSDGIKAELQRVRWSSQDGQWMQQRVSSIPLLYDLQVVAGPDELLKDIDDNKYLVRIPRIGSISEDVNNLCKAWDRSAETSPEYEVRTGAAPDLVKAHSTNSSLAQLYAYDQILKDLQSNDYTLIAQAHLLADRYHLITPISSAVVTDINVVPTPTPPAAKTDFVDAINNFNPLDTLKQAEQDYFNKITSQLTSLSSAAVSNDQLLNQARKYNTVGGGAVNTWGNVQEQPSYKHYRHYQHYQPYQAGKPGSSIESFSAPKVSALKAFHNANAPTLENEELKQARAAAPLAPAAPSPQAMPASVLSNRHAYSSNMQPTMQPIPSLETDEPKAPRADHAAAYLKKKGDDQRDLDTNKGTAYLSRKMNYYRFPAAKEGGPVVESDVAKDQQLIGGSSEAQSVPPGQGDIFESGANAGQAQNNGGNTLSQSYNNAGVNMAQGPSLQGATNGTIGPQGNDATFITNFEQKNEVRELDKSSFWFSMLVCVFLPILLLVGLLFMFLRNRSR